MISRLLLPFFLLLHFYAQAQAPLVWKNTYGEDGDEWMADIHVDEEGNIWFAGYIAFRGDHFSEGDAWYGKLNAAGEKLWWGRWGNKGVAFGTRLLPLNDSSAFLIGDAGWSQGSGLSPQGFYAWVTPDTKIIDQHFIEGDRIDFRQAITFQNGSMLAGGKYLKENSNDLVLLRFSSDRRVLKQKVYRFNENNWLFDFVEKSNGNIVVVGSCGAGITTDLLLFEVDSEFNLVWQKIINDADVELIQNVSLTEDGGYMISGHRYQRSEGKHRAWYAKTDSIGNILWEHEPTIVPPENTGLRMEKYATGQYALTWNVIGDSPDQKLSKNLDIAMLIFNDKGETIWEYTYHSPQTEYIYDLAVNIDGKLLICGQQLKKDTTKTAFVYCFDPQLQNTSVVSHRKPNYINLFVYDKATQSPLEATIKVKHEDGSTELINANENGIATLFLKKGERCSLTIEALGYMALQDAVALPAEGVKQENKYYLVRAKSGTTVVMKNVGFERSTTKLLPGSYEELDRLAQFMLEHSEVKIELSGHTDNGGVAKANQLLSEERVATVKNYLVSKGVSAERITGKGYGGRKPIAPNDSEENKSKNRRVEVKIL